MYPVCSKKIFTKTEAQSALNFNRHTNKSYRKENRLYYCAECNGWHLTSKERTPFTPQYDLKFENKWHQLLNN